MRLRKGSCVEVLRKNDISVGSWFSAKILSGNGHTYIVEYDSFPSSESSEIERVPRKVIRPRPPPSQGTETWKPGDVIEVFHHRSWKLATVLKVTDDNNYAVWLTGCSVQLVVHKFRTRVRKVWSNGKWIVFGKVSRRGTDLRQKGLAGKRIKRPAGNISFLTGGNTQIQRPHAVPKAIVNRDLHGSFDFQAWDGELQGTVIDRHAKMLPETSPCCLEKVDAFVSSDKIVENTCMHSYCYGRTASLRADYRGNFPTSTSPVDTHSSVSSVGSCSSSGDKVSHRSEHHHSEDCGDHYSYAESFCGEKHGGEGIYSRDIKRKVSNSDSTEFDTYRRVIEALYASGPLTWEAESNISDLRKSLGISNDEHLMLIRDIVSVDSRPSIP